MKHSISFLKILFIRSLIYQNCVTDKEVDCNLADFQIVFGTTQQTFGTCGLGDKNLFMGPYGKGSTVTYEIPYLLPNKQVNVSFGLWKLDSWDKEGFDILINDVQIEKLVKAYNDAPDICRNPLFGDCLYPFFYSRQLTQTSFKLTLQDHLDEELDNESWGLRDLIVRLSSLCVNFYSECNYSGELYQICKGDKIKRAANLPYQIKSILMDYGIAVKIKDPNQFGGALQEYSTSQVCIGGYKFPKYIPQ